MFSQYRIPSLLAGAMFLLFSGAASAVEQCPEGEQPLEFRFFTDNNSWKDNGWIMECDYEGGTKELVWSVAIGSIKYQDHTEVIREATCIPDTATCYLNVFDAKGDGLQGSKNGDPSEISFAGWFAFLHGATTVATYKNLEEPMFNELSYCVGPECQQKPQEIQANDEDCQDFVFLAMQLDNNPLDTSYQLICGGEEEGVFDKRIIWNGNGFTKAGAYVEEEVCLPKDACCEFIVVDGDANGLTETVEMSSRSADGTQPKGYIYLEQNYDPILEYDGSTGQTFGVLTKRFACKADKEKEQVDIIATEAVDIPEDVEVGDNVEGVFDPEAEGETPEFLKEDPEDNAEGNKDTNNINDNPYSVFDSQHLWHTFPPTTEDWVHDDDYQNFNDDGKGFGSFGDDYLNGNVLGDDVFRTVEPTLMHSMEATDFPTWAPTSEGTDHMHENWELYDDVVDGDDASWTMMDDKQFNDDGMYEIDAMIQDLDDHTPKLPSDPNAAAFLNGTTRKVGLNKGAKIAVGVLVPLFFLWTIGLTVVYFLGPKDSEDSDDAANEKATTGDADSSGSISDV